MRKALEIRDDPRCAPPAPGRLAHLRIWLSGLGRRKRTAALGQISPHLLRDIGFAHDTRSIHLLQERNFFRVSA